MQEILSSPTADLVKFALDAAISNHRVLSNNVANANTPGFSPQRLDFEGILASMGIDDKNIDNTEQLASSLETRPPYHMLSDFRSTNSDAHVQLDVETALMAQNLIRYQALLNGLAKHSSLISIAIKGGRE